MVLSVDRPRRLLPLYHRLEAVHHHEVRGRHRHARDDARCFGGSTNYYLPGDLENQIEAFVANYNHRSYHESIDNLTPADVYFGRGQTILLERERIKRKTIAQRRLQHKRQAA